MENKKMSARGEKEITETLHSAIKLIWKLMVLTENMTGGVEDLRKDSCASEEREIISDSSLIDDNKNLTVLGKLVLAYDAELENAD